MTELTKKTIIASVLLVIALGAIWFMLTHLPKEAVRVDPESQLATPVVVAPSPEVIEHAWQCHLIVTCPWEDWRYVKAQSVCTYEDKLLSWPTLPLVNDNGGESCKLIK